MSSDRLAPRLHSDWVGIWFGLCVALLAAYQQFKLPPVLPEMLDLYGYGAGMAGGFMSIFAVIGLVLSFQFGRLMSRQATAAWLIGACGLVGLGAIPILTFPENGWAILVGRAFEGTAMAILAIAGPTLMTRNAAPKHIPFAAALAATWVPLGGPDRDQHRPIGGISDAGRSDLVVGLVGRVGFCGPDGGMDNDPGASE